MMTSVKTLSAAIVLSAAITTPAFARPTHHSRVYDLRGFRGVYNELGTPYSTPQAQGQLNIQNFGFSGRDPSRVGGWDPSLHPSGS
jgi:hypothetical protein